MRAPVHTNVHTAAPASVVLKRSVVITTTHTATGVDRAAGSVAATRAPFSILGMPGTSYLYTSSSGYPHPAAPVYVAVR
jgi:hypothetical protein